MLNEVKISRNASSLCYPDKGDSARCTTHDDIVMVVIDIKIIDFRAKAMNIREALQLLDKGETGKRFASSNN